MQQHLLVLTKLGAEVAEQMVTATEKHATHHLYSKVIPIEDLDLFQEAGEIGSLEYELQGARYKVNRLIREQQKPAIT